MIPIPKRPGYEYQSGKQVRAKTPTQYRAAMNRTHRVTAATGRSYRERLGRLDGLRFVTALQMAL
jgi:hypothetical protein